MANHKSALKRIRRNEAARLRNRYQHKTARNAVRKLRALENVEEAKTLFTIVVSMIVKLAKKYIFHANTAANLKISLAKHINKLAK